MSQPPSRAERLLQAERLLTVDLVDRAEAAFQEVLAEDPVSADAIVGVARCALARGDDHEAYRLAARAHALDPGHDMARRMEARMAEVLRARGEVPGAGRPLAEPAAGAGHPAPTPAGTAARPRTLLDRLRGR